ncbi:MAG: ribonuclease HI [Spirochaetes bacterium]|nr:ribonuclease HI [Spirochaetota bacterium]
MKNVDIFTDGGCSGNPGPGGWAYFIITGEDEYCGSGGIPLTTNNRMELTAVIEAIKRVRAIDPGESNTLITINTDSQYVKKGITEWMTAWIRNNWKNSKKKPVKNQDLWKALKDISDCVNIKWNWVPGHSGIDYNERCDKLVQEEIKKIK